MNSYSKTMEMRQKEKVQWKTKFIYYFKLFWFCGGENFKSQTSWTSVQIIELLVILACHVCKHFLMKHIYSVEANILWPLPILFSIFFYFKKHMGFLGGGGGLQSLRCSTFPHFRAFTFCSCTFALRSTPFVLIIHKVLTVRS